jgi:hypothetical protein
VDALGTPVRVAPARPADGVLETPQKMCRWPMMAIRDLTMVAADSALAAALLFHFGARGHVTRIAVHYGTFVPS